jgi:glyoxylase-like metal-dependent hydrolase (beta-lactamase superfamily II)
MMQPQHLPLEDTAADILAKARLGLNITADVLAERLGLPLRNLRAVLRRPAAFAGILPALAPLLELDAVALGAIALGAWHPGALPPVEGFAPFTTSFSGEMTVNNYLLWHPLSRDAAVFDTGADASALLAFAQEHGLRIRAIFITHTHPDHVAALGPLVTATHAPVHVPKGEPPLAPVPAAATLLSFAPDSTFEIGGLLVKALDTSGHSPGQTTFLIHGLSVPIAVTGDALFAGSMGGSANFYREQRRRSMGEILTLPAQTLLAPGHGPLTTVQAELDHNPVLGRGAFFD